MKRNPDITVPMMLQDMLKATSSDDSGTTMHRLDGQETPEERTEAREKVARIISAGGVRTKCIGCGADTQVDESVAICVCGGFVCAACQRVEEEDICNHEPPAWLPSEADDE
jgi:hypothetical protein